MKLHITLYCPWENTISLWQSRNFLHASWILCTLFLHSCSLPKTPLLF
jgi:hypothetical protein